jgi:hypothetical protein
MATKRKAKKLTLTVKQQRVRHPVKYPWGRCADGTPRRKPGRRPGKQWKRIQKRAKFRKTLAAKKVAQLVKKGRTA